MVPAPLLRVVEGTTLVVSVRNDLTSPLRVHGLCARDGGACAPLDVPPGADREVRFASGRAGTYHYWATSMGAPIPFREMGGAFVVDPAGVPVEPDRVFVITEWSDLTPAQLREIMASDDSSARFLAANPKVAFMINGLSWPSTERLTYRLGDPVRWRVINLSSQIHPMHLHGFYYRVQRLGDGVRDETVAGAEGRRVVTQMVPSSGTLTMEWVPERVGNWLFHCHVMAHVAPERRLGATPSGDAAGGYIGDSGARRRRQRRRTRAVRRAWRPRGASRPRSERPVAGHGRHGARHHGDRPRRRARVRPGGGDDRDAAPADHDDPRRLGGRPHAGRHRRHRGRRGPRRLTGPAGGAAARRAGGDHAGQQPQRVDVDALARPRARQLLRRRARLERARARRSRR